MIQHLTQTLARLREQRGWHAASRTPRRALDLMQLEDRLLFSAVPVPFDLQPLSTPVETAPPEMGSPEPAAPANASNAFVYSTPAPADAPAGPAADAIATSEPGLTGDYVFPAAADTATAVRSADLSVPLRRELLFVDPRASGQEDIVADLLSHKWSQRQVEVWVLDAERDGVEQISDILARFRDVDTLHLVGPGTASAIQLGSTWLDPQSVAGYAGPIARWNEALAEGGTLLLHNAALTTSPEGRTLVAALVALSGAEGRVVGADAQAGLADSTPPHRRPPRGWPAVCGGPRGLDPPYRTRPYGGEPGRSRLPRAAPGL